MKPLSKKIRLLSGIFLALIFIILAPIILAGSFGYHLGKFEDVFKLVRTGGIYIMSDVSGVQIYVDDEYIKDNGLFLRNTLIQNLTPNESHKVMVQKEGLHDWVKTLPVYESLVTEARIMMLKKDLSIRDIYPFFNAEQVGTTTPPANLKPNLDLPEDVLIDGFIPTNPEYRQLVNLFSEEENDVYSTTTSLLEDEIQSRLVPTVVDTDEDPSATTSTSTPEIKKVPEYFIELGIEDPDQLENLIIMSNQVAWIEDGNIILNWIDKNNTPYFFYCVEINSCRKQITLDWEDDVLKFSFLPNRNDVFVVLVDSGIYAVEADDRSERNIQPIYLGENLDFIKNDRDQIVVKDSLVFHEINL